MHRKHARNKPTTKKESPYETSQLSLFGVAETGNTWNRRNEAALRLGNRKHKTYKQVYFRSSVVIMPMPVQMHYFRFISNFHQFFAPILIV